MAMRQRLNTTGYFLFKCILVIAFIANTAAINCPKSCKCAWVLDSLEVDCSHQELIEYPEFEGMLIDHLDLSGNHFTEFPSQLANIDSLIYLDLSNNNIEFIDQNALLGFLALRTLILANNSISSWQSINPNVAFTHAVSLKRLILSGNDLGSFTNENPALSLVSESLSQLELKSCGITTVSGDVILNGLPNLERLLLSGNALTTMTTLPSRSLRVLELSSCTLQRISTYLLEGLPNLEALNLSWNPNLQLGSKLGDVIFSRSLNELDVSYCNLDAINLSGLPSLIILHMRGNMLRSVIATTFVNNTQIEILDLARNSLRFVDADSFGKLKRLTKLDLSYNEIARLDRNLFRANDNLVFINLSRNVIEKFTKLVSNSLRDINLSWCEIISIDGAVFTGLSSIQRLDLSNNLIREFPAGMRSETLQKLNLSNCRLSALRNTTFRDFPELASLWLSGNRFTNPFPTDFFRSNKFLDQIWIGDNPWICNCHDETFIDFYDYLTSSPQKLKDKNNARCASPDHYYGKTWETACVGIWIQNGHTSGAGKVWTTIMLSLVVIGVLVFLYTCFTKYMQGRKDNLNHQEYQRNQAEMQEIRRQNARMLQEEGTPNAPDLYETNLPSYEDALLMPKLERPIKSMVDLSASMRTRKKLRVQRARTDPEEDIIEMDEDLVLDNRHRFRSEEMLSNRDKERIAPVGNFRRTGRVEHNNSGSRRFSIEDSRFAPSQLKSQNMQSAEKIGNFQSYENSPYTKRRQKIAEIPPFKRATLHANSIEFLTDPEFDANSKPSSPFSRRKPKSGATPSQSQNSTSSKSSRQGSAVNVLQDAGARLDPAIEDYFGQTKSRSSSTDGSDFQVLVEADVASLPDIDYSSSDGQTNLELGKRKKRKNSISRRASGNFNAAAAAAAGESSSSDRDQPVVVVHKPMRETLF